MRLCSYFILTLTFFSTVLLADGRRPTLTHDDVCLFFINQIFRSSEEAYREFEMPKFSGAKGEMKNSVIFGLQHPHDARRIQKARALVSQGERQSRLATENFQSFMNDVVQKKGGPDHLNPSEKEQYDTLGASAIYWASFVQFYREVIRSMTNPESSDFDFHRDEAEKQKKWAQIRADKQNLAYDDLRPAAAGVLDYAIDSDIERAREFGRDHQGDVHRIQRVKDLLTIYISRMQTVREKGFPTGELQSRVAFYLAMYREMNPPRLPDEEPLSFIARQRP